MKASHNSYQRNETIIEQITWNSATNYDCGCGELELDISQSDDGQCWSVGHKCSYDRNYRQLSSFLSDLTVWSEENPDHDIITLYLDLKHTATDTFPDELDEYIRKRFKVAILSPGQFMKTAATLSQGVLENGGMPYLEDLKGKFLICLTGDRNDKKKYAETKPESRLCFADKDTGSNQLPEDDNRVFFNFHIYHSQRNEWMPVFRECVSKPNVIVRAYVANSEENWNDCLNSGCNIIATDKISNYEWAKVGSSRFVKLK